jgi:hypothetical protein
VGRVVERVNSAEVQSYDDFLSFPNAFAKRQMPVICRRLIAAAARTKDPEIAAQKKNFRIS